MPIIRRAVVAWYRKLHVLLAPRSESLKMTRCDLLPLVNMYAYSSIELLRVLQGYLIGCFPLGNYNRATSLHDRDIFILISRLIALAS